MKFREIINSIQVSEEERMSFISICAEWGRFCEALSHMSRVRVLKLLKYLLDERPNGNRLLERTISRFNRLNALKKEDLDDHRE